MHRRHRVAGVVADNRRPLVGAAAAAGRVPWYRWPMHQLPLQLLYNPWVLDNMEAPVDVVHIELRLRRPHYGPDDFWSSDHKASSPSNE